MRASKYTGETLQQAVDKSLNVSDVVRNLGLKITGSSHRHISSRLKVYNIDTSHFIGNSGVKHRGGYAKKHFTEYLKYGVIVDNKQLRRALIESGRKESCEICFITMWLDKPLRLQIDHIDGNRENCTSENLRFLCPNCHTQTENFGSKNVKKENRPKKKLNYCECGISISRRAQRCRSCKGKYISSLYK